MISPETAIHFAVIPASPAPPKKRCKKSAKKCVVLASEKSFCAICANLVSKCAIFAGRVAKHPALCYTFPVEPRREAARGQATTPSQNSPLLPLPKAHAVRYALQLFYAHKTAIFPCKASSFQHFLHRWSKKFSWNLRR